MSITAEVFRELTQQPVDLATLEASFLPPPHFGTASFDSYKPDPTYPTQEIALSLLRVYVKEITHERPGLLSRLLTRKPKKEQPDGIYLDGGFGVGKTHLLASAFHAYQGSKAYITFQELMFYVGLKRLDDAVNALSKLGLLVIDEFELDDPANTRMVTNLLNQLFASGVHVITSSNTPPGALGEGKFSVRDFAREIGQLTSRFQLLRVDGEDYRLTHPQQASLSHWLSLGSTLPPADLSLSFEELLKTLSGSHPMRIRQSLGSIRSLAISEVYPVDDPHAALRLVYFIDKIYDNDVDLTVTASIPLNELFQKRYFHGGDTKKYLRALSRLKELTGG